MELFTICEYFLKKTVQKHTTTTTFCVLNTRLYHFVKIYTHQSIVKQTLGLYFINKYFCEIISEKI